MEVISYSLVCEAIDQFLNSTKIPEDHKHEAQNINYAVQPIVEEEYTNEIVITLNAVSIFEQVTPQIENGRGAAKRSNPQAGVSVSYSR